MLASSLSSFTLPSKISLKVGHAGWKDQYQLEMFSIVGPNLKVLSILNIQRGAVSVFHFNLLVSNGQEKKKERMKEKKRKKECKKAKILHEETIPNKIPGLRQA